MKKHFIIFFLLFTSITSLYAQDFNKDVFKNRRAKLMEQISDGAFLLYGAEEVTRNSDITYRFRQGSDFYYLTGLEEPGLAMLLVPGAEKEFILFIPKRHFFQILFGGEGLTLQKAMDVYGADTIYTMDKFYEGLAENVYGIKKLYYNLQNEKFNKRISDNAQEHYGRWSPKEIINPDDIIGEMRVIKDEYEKVVMKETVEISCDALAEVMRITKPGMNERELEGILDYVWKKNGSPREGYPPIIASGQRTTILHYDANDGEILNGDLVMMDVACEFGYYSADITRTFPANGKFTDDQRMLYNIALKSLREGIAIMNPGTGWNEVNKKTKEVMAEELFKVGLVTDKSRLWQVEVYYPYEFGHYIGLDTHDAGRSRGDSPRGRLLEPGMIIAIEPGIYVNPVNFEKLPSLIEFLGDDVTEEEVTVFMEKVRPRVEKYANICVRPEDNILITKDGHINLSAGLAHEADEIEALMAEESLYIKQ